MRLTVRIIIWTLALIPTAATTVFSADLTVTLFSAYAGQTNIVLQADNDVIFSGGSMNLPDLPPGTSSGLLSVQAGNDIIIQDGTSISAGQGWSLSFLAVNDVNLGTGSFLNTDPAAEVTIQAGGQIEISNTGSGLPIVGGGTIIISDGGQPITVTNSGTIQAPQLILLNSHLNSRFKSAQAVAGTNVLFLFIADDITPLSYQWFKNGRKLHGETNAFLSLTNIRRADAGNYSIVVPTTGGRIKSNVHLDVLPQQRLRPPHNAGRQRFR
jgi:hypothetical protein